MTTDRKPKYGTLLVTGPNTTVIEGETREEYDENYQRAVTDMRRYMDDLLG